MRKRRTEDGGHHQSPETRAISPALESGQADILGLVQLEAGHLWIDAMQADLRATHRVWSYR